jgi:hypothetical protein
MMKLKEYLTEKQIGVVEMAKQLNFPQSTCSMWLTEKRLPSKENMQKIYEWSGGRVEPNDFYNINDIEKELNDGGSQTDYPSEG